MSKGNRKVEQQFNQRITVVKKSESMDYTEEVLSKKTNTDLRDILFTFDGATAAKSKNKTQLVSLILAEQAK